MPEDNVVALNLGDDVPPDEVLRAAMAHGLTEVLIIGYGKDGQEYFAFSHADGTSLLWLAELFKHRLLSNAPTGNALMRDRPADVVPFRKAAPPAGTTGEDQS